MRYNVARNLLKILLEGTQESVLFSRSLEATLTKLRGSVDPFELNLLKGSTGSVDSEGLSKSDNSLLGTRDGTLDDKEIVVDFTISDETTHRSDSLLGAVKLGGGVRFIRTTSDSVDLVVNGSTVMITVLTSTGNSPLDVGRMPGTDTGNLSETSVSLSGELLSTPSVGNTLKTVTLGDSDDINDLVLFENSRDIDSLLKVFLGPFNLVGDGTTVELDFSEVSLLLNKRSLTNLGVDEDTNNRSVLLNSGKFGLDFRGTLSILLGVLGESLLLAAVPVLVESSLDFIRKMFSPDSGEGSETTRSLNVTNNTNNNKRRSVNNCNSLNNLTLVVLGTTSIKVTNNGGHTSLVTKEGSESKRLGLVILREGFNSSSVAGSSLSRHYSLKKK